MNYVGGYKNINDCSYWHISIIMNLVKQLFEFYSNWNCILRIDIYSHQLPLLKLESDDTVDLTAHTRQVIFQKEGTRHYSFLKESLLNLLLQKLL